MKIIKKILCINLIVLAFLIMPVIVKNRNYTSIVQATNSIRINKTSKKMKIGDKYTLKLIGTYKKAKWTTSNKEVATVNSKGKVIAKNEGTTTIAAKLNGKKYKCKIKVVDKPTINKTKKTLNLGNSFNIEVTGTNKEITFESSDEKIATVNANGKVKSKNTGKVSIIAKAGNTNLKCEVNVVIPQFPNTKFYNLEDVAIEHIKLEGESIWCEKLDDLLNEIKEDKIVYNIDLDKDGIEDEISIEKEYIEDEGLYGFDGTFTIKCNGKELDDCNPMLEDEIYIVDLNKKDKKIEIVIENNQANGSYGVVDYYFYDIYQKDGEKTRKLVEDSYNNCGSYDKIKINKKGKILTRDKIETEIYPYVATNYFELTEKGKIKKVKANISGISKINFKTKSNRLYFVNNIKNVGKNKKANKLNIGTKIKILKNVYYDKNSYNNVMKVKLKNGKIGFIYYRF